MHEQELRFDSNEDAAPNVEGSEAKSEVHEEKTNPEGSKAAPKKDTAAQVKDVFKQVETFGQALSDALQARGNVVMVRVNDEALEHLDMLIEAEVTKSRSESAAFLINEGVKANQELFNKIGAITQQISDLREQLKKQVNFNSDAESEES